MSSNKNISIMTKNIKLTIEYDGTNYKGWQIQAGFRTIQGELKNAIHELTQKTVNIIGSGRTDTGVHAKNQIANFHIDSNIPGHAFAKALNAKLPHDIVIKKSEEVLITFHSQFDATAKAYSYQIYYSHCRPALERNHVYWVWHPVDVSLMQSAIRYLIGTHDFSSFEAANSPRKSRIRTINKVDISQQNCYITVLIEANGFLYKMVRNIVGTIVEIGQKKYPPEKMQEILLAKNRNCAGNTAPAKGLFLEYVLYKQ